MILTTKVGKLESLYSFTNYGFQLEWKNLSNWYKLNQCSKSKPTVMGEEGQYKMQQMFKIGLVMKVK